jgi:hypothetical protein
MVEKADKIGGKEKNLKEYTEKDIRPGCDQLAHLLRSLFWQPNHRKHLVKIKGSVKLFKIRT